MSCFTAVCPKCGKQLEIDSAWQGSTLPCPVCLNAFTAQPMPQLRIVDDPAAKVIVVPPAMAEKTSEMPQSTQTAFKYSVSDVEFKKVNPERAICCTCLPAIVLLITLLFIYSGHWKLILSFALMFCCMLSYALYQFSRTEWYIGVTERKNVFLEIILTIFAILFSAAFIALIGSLVYLIAGNIAVTIPITILISAGVIGLRFYQVRKRRWHASGMKNLQKWLFEMFFLDFSEAIYVIAWGIFLACFSIWCVIEIQYASAFNSPGINIIPLVKKSGTVKNQSKNGNDIKLHSASKKGNYPKNIPFTMKIDTEKLEQVKKQREAELPKGIGFSMYFAVWMCYLGCNMAFNAFTNRRYRRSPALYFKHKIRQETKEFNRAIQRKKDVEELERTLHPLNLLKMFFIAFVAIIVIMLLTYVLHWLFAK